MNTPRILVISNPMPHYHRVENTLPQLEHALQGMELAHTQNIDVLADESLMSYDGILVYCTGQKISDEQFDGLQRFVASGKALIGIHNATDTWKNNPDYIQLIGGRFVTHPPQLMIRVEVVDATHPITQGMSAFEIWDELYVMETDPANYHLLLQTRSHEDRLLPIAWIKEYGQGRVFYTALGHEPVERADGGPFNPHFHELLRRGALWALGRLSTDQ
ncbi:MAG: ThuA domain-containing protein [Armatimonadota bacterium]|nr:ThuA domain-containing protein [Armatimonadota bacterium]